jgi:hypothetical protein
MKNKPKIGHFFTLFFGLCMVFVSCDTNMGLGDIVDTTPPQIVILSPHDNQWLDINRGDPILIQGTWWDDIAVTRIAISKLITESGTEREEFFTPDDGLVEVVINEDNTWRARINIETSGEYRIRATAWDAFHNRAQDTVNIRLALLDPLIYSSSILRYLDSGLAVATAPLRSREYYEALDYQGARAYQRIRFVNIDEFQNEAFTLRVQFADSFEGVAASRLWVLDTQGERLHEDPLVPNRGGNSYMPEWDITASDMVGWNPAFASGAHFIQFEIWAWNNANWSDGVPGDKHREQIISGACWYPESDRPRIVADGVDISSGIIALAPNENLLLDVYDDDRLAEIYAVLISKERFDELRGSETEAQFLESLKTDETRRNQITNNNLFLADGSGLDQRRQFISVSTGDVGEFRLIAMARDAKGGPNTHYNYETEERENDYEWSVHPPLHVFIISDEAPIIIVDNPITENIFPTLNQGKFNMAGYTIDKRDVNLIQIAWVPIALVPMSTPGNPTDFIAVATSALRETTSLLQPGQHQIQNGVHIWNLHVSDTEEEILNGIDYARNNFSHEFDIINSFPNEARQEKRFVIHARNIGGGEGFKPFRLSGHRESPSLIMYYPFQDMQVHDTGSDLRLHMGASAAFGICINQASLRITDVTPGNNNPDYGFIFPNPTANLNEKRRTVPTGFIQDNFSQGSQRTYRFEAEDILGNRIDMQRTIIMSNVPTLLYITSSNGPGLYKEGEVLRFEAVFSMPVRVIRGTGAGPRLKLYFFDPGNGEPAIITSGTSKNGAYANYMEGFEGNTIIFTYTVTEGDNAPKLFTSLNPIVLANGAALKTTENIEAGDGQDIHDDANITFFNQNNSLQSNAEMALDGIRPTITRASFAQTGGNSYLGGNSYFNNGKFVTLELTTSEQVLVSGSPGTYIGFGNNRVKANFSSVRHLPDASVLEFTWLVNVDDVPQTQLFWAADLRIEMGVEDSITDMAGNLINLSDAALPTGSNLNGDAANRRAWIITRPPAPPSFTLHAANTGNPPVITDNPLRASQEQYIRVTGDTGAVLYYSLRGGIEPEQITADAFGELTDRDFSNRNRRTYIPSDYTVTAWQVDRAGNSSPPAAQRSVTINSRAPELDGISGPPAGSYSQGAHLTFRLNFSRPVRATADHTPAAPIRLTLRGTVHGYSDTMEITMVDGANRDFNTLFTFEGTVPAGRRLAGIKAIRIELSGVVDEYGNTMKTWEHTDALWDNIKDNIEPPTTRPITYDAPFNFDNQNLRNVRIISVRPGIIGWTPASPGAASLGNGGIMAGTGSRINDDGRTMTTGNRIVLEFDRDVLPQAGGLITIRPWGTWALPPILTIQEMDDLLKENFGADQTEYERRLRWIDDNGLPVAPYADRERYNFYTRNTNGLVNIGGFVRPDTSAKWVLGFQHDLYGDANEQRLRDVFNAAKWKWQEIPSNSGSVTFSGSGGMTRNIVTITLRDLEPGRIWEVIITEDAFRDAAGNPSDPIVSSTETGTHYRFWSAGTAAPVIRVDKFSHGDHYQGTFTRGTQIDIPQIDTRVRIDSETPGASIRYELTRTRYVLNNAFSSTTLTASGFFNHPNVPGGGLAGNVEAGFNNNSIGNGGMHHPTNADFPPSSSANIIPPPTDSNDFFVGLLVPIQIQGAGGTTTPIPIGQNGAITQANLTAMGTNLIGGGGTNYRNINASGAITRANAVFQGTRNLNPVFTNFREHFFYAGDAFTTGTGAEADATITSNTDSRLYTGRRDYIAAIAVKGQVDTGAFAGGALSPSPVAYEGVFKTTVLFREFGARSSRFIVQGTDTPTIPTTPGFPLRISYTDTPPGVSPDLWNAYFNRQSYRTSGTVPATGNNTDNDYIWVSWDIVTDWYLMGRGFNGTANGFMERHSYNYNGILATYGAVTYRYRQFYTNGPAEAYGILTGTNYFIGPSR